MVSCDILIERTPRSGSWNMALDEALLLSAIETGQAAIRWYRWETATVSLGYFQDASALAGDPVLRELPAVRRLSGGGAILHHHEWTYSCVIPPGHPIATQPARLYDIVHEAIIVELRTLGIQAAMRGEANPAAESAFLCFGRGDQRDIVLADHKIVGSAQRRRRGAVLQHGSLLLRRSEFASVFPGLEELCPKSRFDRDSIERISIGMGTTIGTYRMLREFSESIRQAAARLENGYCLERSP